MQIQFYATSKDFANLLSFVWNNVEGRFFERYSDFGDKLRSFETLSDLTDYLQEPDSKSKLIGFYVAEALPLLNVEPILDKETGDVLRYALRGWGMFSFHLDDVDRTYPRPRHEDVHKPYANWPFRWSGVSVNSRARAQLWSDTVPDSVDIWPWPKIESAARRIERYVRKNAVARGRNNFGMFPGAAAVIAAGPSYGDEAR